MASKTKCRTSNLTGIRKWKFWLAHRNNRTLQGLLSLKSKIKMWLHHDEKVYSVKLHVSAPCWKSFLVKLRALYVVFAHQCFAGVFLENGHRVWLGVASIFLSLVFEKTLQMAKELVKMIRAGLDVATCGVANATSFYSVATKFSRLVANLAPKIGHFRLWKNVH